MAAIWILVAAPWFGLTAANMEGGCVIVMRIDPKAPAGLAGLREGDCVERINGKRVEGVEHFIQLLRQTNPGDDVLLVLSDHRTVTVHPSERTEDVVRRYCSFASSIRTEVRVFNPHEGAPASEQVLVFSGDVTLAEIRNHLHEAGPVRLVSASDRCVDPGVPATVTDDPSDSIVIQDGAVLFFNYHLIRAFAVFPDGGTLPLGLPRPP